MSAPSPSPPAYGPHAGRRAGDHADVARFEALVAAHSGAVLAHVVQWTQDRHVAEDVMQETWLRAWRHSWRLTDDRGSVRSWLLRVAHNVVVDFHRARTFRAGEVAMRPGLDVESRAASAEQRVLDLSLAAQVLALAGPALRLTLVEVYLRDRTLQQAATRLGVSVGTVKSRLHYGVRRLRRRAGEAVAA